MQPDFSDARYWDDRFSKEAEFEWLKKPGDFLPHIKASLEEIPEEDKRILHIGPGSSTLSMSLRNLVLDPMQVHNVDYSQSAITLGKATEQREFPNAKAFMHWTCSNLLDIRCVSMLARDQLFNPQYSLVVDKSTTDAVACGPDVGLSHRCYRTRTEDFSFYDGNVDVVRSNRVHPVIVLALNLAILTGAGAHWLCLSYSNERFPFYCPDDGETSKVLGDLNPSKYWSLEHKEPIPVKNLDSVDGNLHGPIHHPEVPYWLYTLKRTNEELSILSL